MQYTQAINQPVRQPLELAKWEALEGRDDEYVGIKIGVGLVCVSMCHLLNANKENKYMRVLEKKYNVREDFDTNFKDHLLGFLMFCTHTNITYFILLLECRREPQKIMHERSLSYLL